MTKDQGSGTDPFKTEGAASSGTDRDRREQDSSRQQTLTPEQQVAANRVEMTVRHSLKLGPQETVQGPDDE